MYPILVLLSIGLLAFVFFSGLRKKRKPVVAPRISPKKAHQLLSKHVRFYRDLTRDEQAQFRERAKAFLETVAITPVTGVKLSTLDRIYVACAAIIPIFRFPNWMYKNLNEVIIHPGNFSKNFRGGPEDQNVMGMVGDGAMHRTMVLSIGALRTGFEQHGRGNTGIHEAVHLLDKSDGAVDGVPEMLLSEELMEPWLEVMRREIEAIRAGDSDINPYGGTSEAEFFAVVSEYYFQRPVYMKEKHPELFDLLDAMYSGDKTAAPEASDSSEDTASGSAASA